METQQEIVVDKAKQVFKKRGYDYTRKGYDIKVEVANKFKKKCQMLGETETRVVEKLIEGFCRANGWGDMVKSAEFEPKAEKHILQAVFGVHKDYLPWGMN